MVKVNKENKYSIHNITSSILNNFNSNDFHFDNKLELYLQSITNNAFSIIDICKILNKFLHYYMSKNGIYDKNNCDINNIQFN